MPRNKSKSPDPVDIKVGLNIKCLREFKGLSQAQLGKIVKVTFQQIQKYENGTNRVCASRLSKIAKALDVTEQRLFQGIHKELKNILPKFEGQDMKTLNEFITIPDVFVKEQIRRLITVCNKSRKS